MYAKSMNADSDANIMRDLAGEPEVTHYSVTVHTPGYLPDGDIDWTTEDLTTARRALADEIQRDWDAEYVNPEDYSSVDARYLDAHTRANTVAPGESIYVPGRSFGFGRMYTLVIVEGDQS